MSLNKLNTNKLNTDFYHKIFPLDGSVQWPTVTFEWSKSVESFSGYYFYRYVLVVNGQSYTISDINQLSLDVSSFPGTGESLSWQVYVEFKNSYNQIQSWGYDDETEYHWFDGVQAATISGTTSSTHPKIYWNSVPNANAYLIYYKYSPTSSWTLLGYTTDNYIIDDRFSIKGANGYIYYSVRAGYGPLPLWFIAADYSNTISFYVDTNIANIAN